MGTVTQCRRRYILRSLTQRLSLSLSLSLLYTKVHILSHTQRQTRTLTYSCVQYNKTSFGDHPDFPP